jgi:hypothetical protein
MPVNPNPDYYKRYELPEKNGISRNVFCFDRPTEMFRFNEEIADIYAEQGSRAKMELDEMRSNDYMENYVRRRSNDVEWYGTTDPSLLTSNPTQFLFANELDNFLNTLRNRTINVDTISLDQNKNIKFTEQEIGVFSFDLASLGLIPVYDFYSDLLKKVVKPNYVRAEKDEDGKNKKDADGDLMFYHIYKEEIPEHEIIYDAGLGGFYSPLLKRIVQENEFVTKNIGGLNQYLFIPQPEVQKHPVERRNQLTKDGKKRFTTTFKKVFVYIPKIEKDLPRIDIIITSSYSYLVRATDEMIYSSMSAIALAEKLSRSGVSYKIVVAFSGSTINDQNKQFYSFITLKSDGQVLDRNLIASSVSDARFYRASAFQTNVAVQYDSGWDDDIGGGLFYIINDNLMILKKANGRFEVVSIDDQQPRYGMDFKTEQEAEDYAISRGENVNRVKNAYIDMLRMSNDPTDRKEAENRASKIVFSGALNLQQAENQYNLAVQQISRI